MRQLILVGGECGAHLRHVGLALLPHLSHHLGLVEKGAALVALLRRLVHGPLAIHEVHVSLVHLQRHVVLLRLHGAAPHGDIGAGEAQLVVALQTVEQREGSLQTVAVVERAHVGVGVGRRVDGASEVELSRHRAVHLGQERPYGACLLGAAVVEGVALLRYGVTVVGGILHAAVYCPRLGGAGCGCGSHDEYS